jgi:hypothetical protein
MKKTLAADRTGNSHADRTTVLAMALWGARQDPWTGVPWPAPTEPNPRDLSPVHEQNRPEGMFIYDDLEIADFL